jgi:hypothetical protein
MLHHIIESYMDCLKSKLSEALADSYSYAVKLWLDRIFGQVANQFNQRKNDKMYFVAKGLHSSAASQSIYDSISHCIISHLNQIKTTLLSFLDRNCTERYENITSEYVNCVLKNLQKNVQDINSTLPSPLSKCFRCI